MLPFWEKKRQLDEYGESERLPMILFPIQEKSFIVVSGCADSLVIIIPVGFEYETDDSMLKLFIDNVSKEIRARIESFL